MFYLTVPSTRSVPTPSVEQSRKKQMLYSKDCHVPARWGLQQTTLAPGNDETRANTYTKYLDKVNLMINYQKLTNTDRLLVTVVYTSCTLATSVYDSVPPVYVQYILGAQCTVLVYAQCAISVPSVHCQCTSSIH